MKIVYLILLLCLAGCAPGVVQPPPGYCPWPLHVDATGYCAAPDRPLWLIPRPYSPRGG
jgi:hypothetical protein